MAQVAHPRTRPPVFEGRFQSLRTRARRAVELTRTILRNPTTLVGAAIIVLIVGMAVFAPLLQEPHGPNPYQMPRDWNAIDVPPGSPGHPLGTTSQGGDVLYGLVWGARNSLRLAFTVVTITVVVGVAVGSLAGFLGRRWDEMLMRVVDVFMAIPELILALAIAAVLGPSFRNVMLAIAVVGWPKYARIIRGQIIHVKQNEYVDAARISGDSTWRIYRRDVLPNSFTPIAVQATLEMGHAVLYAATLSFIGLAEAGLAEWGNLVSAGQEGILAGRWWVSTFGGILVFLWSLGFNLLGDGLRDVLDPRIEGR